MTKKSFLTSVLGAFAIASLLLNVCLIFLIVRNTELYQKQQEIDQILNFRNIFEEKFLLIDGAVNFDDRFSLETAVRSLNDQEIFDQWQRFTESPTKSEATIQAKLLLKLLIDKTSR